MKIKEIKNDTAIVNHNSHDFRVSTQLIPKAQKGDWILAHGEIGISIIPEDEAKNILALIEKADGKTCSCS